MTSTCPKYDSFLFLSLIPLVLSYPLLLSTLAAFSPRVPEGSLSKSQTLSKHVAHLVMKKQRDRGRERERERERKLKGWGRVSLLLTGGYIRQYIVSVVSVAVSSLLQQLNYFSFSMQDHNHKRALLAWCLLFLVLVQQVIMIVFFFIFFIFYKWFCSRLPKLLAFDIYVSVFTSSFSGIFLKNTLDDLKHYRNIINIIF